MLMFHSFLYVYQRVNPINIELNIELNIPTKSVDNSFFSWLSLEKDCWFIHILNRPPPRDVPLTGALPGCWSPLFQVLVTGPGASETELDEALALRYATKTHWWFSMGYGWRLNI